MLLHQSITKTKAQIILVRAVIQNTKLRIQSPCFQTFSIIENMTSVATVFKVHSTSIQKSLFFLKKTETYVKKKKKKCLCTQAGI